MTEEEFDSHLDNGDFDDMLTGYIMDNATIGNGDMLINALESGVWHDGFKDYCANEDGTFTAQYPRRPSVSA